MLMKQQSVVLAATLAAICAGDAALAALTDFDKLDVEAGDTQVRLQKSDPFSLFITGAEQSFDGSDARYIEQKYTGIKLVDGSGALVYDLTPDSATDVVHRAQETENFYYAALGTHVGGDQGVDVIGVNYLARKSFDYDKISKQDVRDNYPDERVCIAPLTGPGVCPAKSVEAGDFKFSIYIACTGENYVLPTGAKYMRIETEYTIHGDTSNLEVYFNGDTNKQTPGDDQLTSVTFVNKNTNEETVWELVQTANIKDTEVADMVIKATLSTENDVPKLSVNYDMPVDKLTAKNDFAVYDPTITVKPVASTGAAAETTVPIAAVLLGAAIAAIAARE